MVHPSSIKMNHNYRSGFLEHVLSMAKVAKKITPLYDVDKDLVLVGVLLNNIGKLREINYEQETSMKVENDFKLELLLFQENNLKIEQQRRMQEFIKKFN